MLNKKIYIIIVMIIILFSCVSCTRKKQENIFNNNNIRVKESQSKNSEEDRILEIIQKMTLEEKIGQLLIIGFNGVEMNEELEKVITEYKIGGLIFFDRNINNINQTKSLIDSIYEKNKEKSNLPLFICVDEEGGVVSRLSKILGDTINMNELGKIDDEKLTEKYGILLANRLNFLGFNYNFAPVLDINSNKKNPVIGDRSFGDNKELVAKHSKIITKQLNKKNIVVSGKHFPGHGDTNIDSHKSLPVLNKSKEDIYDLELYPFIEAIDDEIDSIMIGHLLYEELDKNNPASLSKNIITKLLREELNYNGLVITDDLTMSAITNKYTVTEALINFYKAGGDIGLICHDTEEDIDEIIQELLKKIESKEILEEDIDEKLYRIIKVKRKYNLDYQYKIEEDYNEIENNRKKLIEEINNKR